MDKLGYNYRICNVNSLAAMMPFMTPEDIKDSIVPIFMDRLQDPIPNVQFVVCKQIRNNK